MANKKNKKGSALHFELEIPQRGEEETRGRKPNVSSDETSGCAVPEKRFQVASPRFVNGLFCLAGLLERSRLDLL